MKSFLLLFCVLGLQGIGKATLEIRQGRFNGRGILHLIPVVGIATVELGGNPVSRPTYFFECFVNGLSMNDGSAGIRWTRMGDVPLRFDVWDIPGGNLTGKRMEMGGIGYADLGVYVCTDSATNERVSVNITGANPAIMAVGKRVKVVQDQSVALEVYVAGYPIPTESQITWYYPDNTPIVGSTAEEVKFERGRKKLILSDVQPDQAGLYSCQVEISLTPYLGAKTDVHLEVLAKPSIRAFSADPIQRESEFVYTVPLNYIGTILVCRAEGWPMADIEWQKNGFILPKESDIISDSEYNATSTSNSDVTTVLGKLTWKREFRNSDEGEYECIVHQRNSTSLKAVSQTIELEAVTVTMHPVTDRPWTVCRSNVSERVMYFQIRTVGVDCHNWMEPLKELITTEVHHELLQAVEDECHCAVDDRELRLIGVPQCSIQMDDAAVFHGVIQTNSLEKTRLIYCALSVWLQRSGQIEIDGRFQAIDPSCSLEATDALSEECAPLVEEVTPSSENNAKEIRILAIAGGIGGFITIVVLLITIVCCIGCYYQLRTRNLKSKRDEGVHGSKGVDHTYDHIDYCSRYSISVPTNASKSGEQEIGAESLHSYYGQLQLTKFTDTQEDTQSDTEQIYEQISNLDLQLEDEEAQPYCEPVKILAKTTAA